MNDDKIIKSFNDTNCCCTNQHCKHVRGVCHLDEDEVDSFKRRYCGTCRLGMFYESQRQHKAEENEKMKDVKKDISLYLQVLKWQ